MGVRVVEQRREWRRRKGEEGEGPRQTAGRQIRRRKRGRVWFIVWGHLGFFRPDADVSFGNRFLVIDVADHVWFFAEWVWEEQEREGKL